MDGAQMEGDESGTLLRTRSARLKAAGNGVEGRLETSPPMVDENEEVDEKSQRIGGRRSSLRKQTNGLGISHAADEEEQTNKDVKDVQISSEAIYDLAVDSVEEVRGETSEAEDLMIRNEDLKKLVVVIRAFAPDLLGLRTQQQSLPSSMPTPEISDPRRRGAERRAARASDQTLDDLLSQSKVGIRQLRDHLIKLRSPLIRPSELRAHLSGSNVLPSGSNVDGDRSKLAAISTCLALVDEIARSMRQKQRLVSEERHYALQMRLPGGDYFTNAVPLTSKEVSEIDPAYAHITDVSSHRLAPQSQSIPTLSSRLFDTLRSDKVHGSHIVSHPITRQRREDDEFAKPVSNLYYGPWSSFGPTYDSFDGQLTQKASNALWRAKRDENVELKRWANSKPSLLGIEARERLEEDIEVINEELDVDLILDGYDSLPDFAMKQDQKDIDEILERNATLLLWLQNLQEQRWHQLMGKSLTNGRYVSDGLAEPDQNEQKIARTLLASLTSLLSVQPRNVEEGQQDAYQIIPSLEKLQSLSASAALDPALLDGNAEKGYWGTLDSTLFGPELTRRQALSRSMASANPVAAIRDNETLRLSNDTEEKAATQTMSLGATVLGANRDRGKGLLDRFAGSRKYELADHPHDRKPPIPPAPVRPPPPPAQAVPTHPTPGKPPFSSPQQPFARPGYPQQQFHHPHHQQRTRQGYPQSGTVSYARPSPLASLIRQ